MWTKPIIYINLGPNWKIYFILKLVIMIIFPWFYSICIILVGLLCRCSYIVATQYYDCKFSFYFVQFKHFLFNIFNFLHAGLFIGL